MTGAVTAGSIAAAAAVVGATAAVAGGAVAASQANRANKEQNRQKSIAASQQAVQNKLVGEAKQKEEALSLKDKLEIEARQRADTSRSNEVSDIKRKTKLRGRRSLISGLETGIEKDTLG